MPLRTPFRQCFHAALCAVAIIAFACPQAPCDLIFRGGSLEQQTRIRAIYDSHVPSEWRTSVAIRVNLLSDSQMKAYVNDGSSDHMQNSDSDESVDGIYEDGPPTITLRKSTDGDTMPLTFSHEFGHFFWQYELSRTQRAQYVDIYARQRHSHHLVTDYAGVDVHEGFAEAFSYYVVDRQILASRDVSSCDFLDKVLHRNR